MAEEVKRKFRNPTRQFVGAVIYDEDGKRKGVPIEPGGFIWLSEREERATAEAPVRAEDNPFIAAWEDVVEATPEGEPLSTVTRQGMLVLADEGPRPIASERYIPGRGSAEPAPEPEEDLATGAPPTPTTEPEVGQPSEEEVVATPEAVPANDREKAARAAEEPTPVTDRPQGPEAIKVPPKAPLPV